MTRTSTRSFFAALAFLITSLSANSSVFVNNGTTATYVLFPGDSLHIASGTYTGTILNWQAGAKISVAAGASFKPTSASYFMGVMYIYGSATLPSISGQVSSFYMKNYGNTTVSGDTYLAFGATLENTYGASITFNGAVTMNNANLVNSGTINAKGDWYAALGSDIINNNVMNVQGNLQLNSSTLVNGGKFYTQKNLTLSYATVTNNCKTIADNAIDINAGTFTNNGLLWATSAKNNASITNSGTIISTPNGRVKSRNFTNNGTLSGNGYFYFTGVTTNNLLGRIGKTGTTTDSIRIYDASRTSQNGIFDYQYGTVYSNVKYTTVAAPDTVNAYTSCAMSYMSNVVTLPVKWNYFYVNLSNNIPALTWSSQQDGSTRFEIERSYDGNNFSAIALQFGQAGTDTYKFDDKLCNTQVNAVYYRIRAIELSGAEKLSEVKVIRFSAKQGITVQTTPNPFTSQFNINYQSTEKGTLMIKVFSMTGQLQTTKTVSVSKGFNSISITEAANLARGIYMVQLSANGSLIATEKVVKQ